MTTYWNTKCSFRSEVLLILQFVIHPIHLPHHTPLSNPAHHFPITLRNWNQCDYVVEIRQILDRLSFLSVDINSNNITADACTYCKIHAKMAT